MASQWLTSVVLWLQKWLPGGKTTSVVSQTSIETRPEGPLPEEATSATREFKLMRLSQKKADQLAADLARCSAAMRQACERVEKDFLAMGERLQAIYGQATQLAQMTQAAVEKIGHDAEDNMLVKVTQTSRQALDELDQGQGRILECLERVRTVGDQLLGLHKMIAGLKGVAKTLKIVAININIESSRSAESHESFLVLAREIRALSDTVADVAGTLSEETKAIAADLDAMHQVMGRKLSHFQQVAQNAHTQLDRTIPEVQALISGAMRALQHVGDDAQILSRSTGEIVVNLQIHDNTSQRIEHIVHALAQARQQLEQAGGDTNAITLAHTNFEPQQAQLKSILEDIDQVHQALEEIDPELCYMAWDIVLTTSQDENAVRDVFIFVEDISEIKIQKIQEDPADHKKIGEILVERGDVSCADLETALNRQSRIDQVLVSGKIVSQGAVDAALAEQTHLKQRQFQKQESLAASSIRVASEKLDKLVDLVGELVTVQARLSQKAAAQEDADLLNIAEVVERLTAELRDNTMSIRMLPIGTTFSKFKRLVRDLSNELGKKVVLTTAGGQTELDKKVIEQLNDPLVHIIRNSIDHGVESPGMREAAGKPREGKVHLSAEHSGANVLIRICDDGAGLNAAAIRETAVAKGLIPPEADKSDRELFNLIFAPGFSTIKNVTSVSGRGVGMDVVKRGIESLRGNIEVESTAGQGTAITLKLPLTLAIIDGLLVETDGEKYVLPLSIIEECVELTREDVRHTHGRNILNIRGDLVPYISLRERFRIQGAPPDIEQIVIGEAQGQRLGIVVDRVIGQRQIVIKTMSKVYNDVDEISGATILGDGTIALILDIAKLLETDEEESERKAA